MTIKKDIHKVVSLLYLQALSEYKSKREVAEKTGASVDTINKHISDLEAEYHIRLQVSNGRGTTITPEGRHILKLSSGILKSLNDVEEYAGIVNSDSGVVRLGLPDALADYLGTNNLGALFNKYPGLSIESHIDNKIPDMTKLEADICFSYEIPTYSDLVLIEKKAVEGGLFAAPSYINKYGTPQNFEDLLQNHHICTHSNHQVYAPGWKEVLEKAHHVVYSTSSIFSYRKALESGIGIGLSPIYYGTRNLTFLKHLNYNFNIYIYLLAHKDTKDMPRIRIVLDYLHDLMLQK